MTNSADENYTMPQSLKITLGILALLIFLLLGFIIYQYSTSLTDGFIPDYPNRDEWGVFGDFFGGVLNPLFGFASFIALLATIFYQAKELNASTRELRNSATALAAQNKAIELQSFEQTFFSWLVSYQDLLKSIEADNIKYIPTPNSDDPYEKLIGKRQTDPKNGRSQLYYWWSAYLTETSIWTEIKNSETIPKSSIKAATDLTLSNRPEKGYLLSIAELHPKDVCDLILTNWRELYADNEYQLDSLFRTLYRLIIWIDSQDISRVTSAQKWLYISIIRAQLSWIEMAYLYFNGLTSRGSNFKVISEKYALFDNLTIESDATIESFRRYFDSNQNYADTAFSSEAAREKLGLPKSSEDTLALATATSTPLCRA